MNSILFALLLAATAQLSPAGPAAEVQAEAAPAPPTPAAEAVAKAQAPYYQGDSRLPLSLRKTPEGDPILMATIKADNDVIIPAEAEGTIIDVLVREGTRAAKGQMLVTIDDRQAQAGVEVASFGLQAALQ